MENKDKNILGKIPNKPYLVWLMILCAVVFLVSLPKGGAGSAS